MMRNEQGGVVGYAPTQVQSFADGGSSLDWMASEKLAAHMPKPATTGFIHSEAPGRTDIIRAQPPGGSFVIPADVVSGVGQGNSLAGSQILQKALGMGAYGSSQPHIGHGGVGMPSPPPKFSGTMLAPAAKRGGKTDKNAGVGHPTPILAAGGELIVPHDVVARWGGGDLTKGADLLDHFVVHKRKEIIKEMQALKGPKRARGGDV